MSQAIIYLIRHGEKPEPEADGLSALGLKRSEALPGVFGPGSPYNIGYILAEHPKKDGSRARPRDTVLPLANALGLDIDTSVDRNDSQGVAEKVRNYNGQGNILICWEHGQLQDIMQAIGISDAPAYPGTRFDLIFTVPPPWTEVASVTSENIQGLDDGHQNP